MDDEHCREVSFWRDLLDSALDDSRLDILPCMMWPLVSTNRLECLFRLCINTT